MTQKSKIFTGVVVSVCLLLCLSLSYLLSSYIAISAFSTTKQTSVSQKDFSLFAISAASSQVKSNITDKTQIYQKQGGAAYIYYDQQNYHLLLSCYANKTDAQNVMNNLNIETSQIVELQFNKQSISHSGNKQELDVLQKAITFFYDAYYNLYDLSISLDTKVLNEDEAQIKLSQIIGSATQTVSAFESLFNNQLTNKILLLKLQLNNALKILQNIEKNTTENCVFQSAIKHAYFDILNCYLSLNN